MGKGAIRNNLPIAVLAFAAAGLGAAAMTLGNGDAVVERGFQRAFADLDGKAVAGQAPAGGRWQRGVLVDPPRA